MTTIGLHSLEINSLKVELNSLREKHKQVLQIKNEEIESLTSAALKRPNDYSVWWATGGFATGVLTVLSIFWVTK